MSFQFASPVVDTHIHVWDLRKMKYAWLDSSPVLKPIHSNYLPSDYINDAKGTPVRNAIFVQTLNEGTEENDWVLELTKQHRWLVGLVGWVDLTSPEVEKVIEQYAKSDRFLGIRHVTEPSHEADPDWMGREEIHLGLSALGKHNLAFDLVFKPHNMHYHSKIVPRHPDVTFVVDHLAKPKIKDGEMDGWKEEMTKLASYPNVFCKLSGMVEEDDPVNWKVENFKPYVKHCIKVFGAARCMFGSNYPVFQLSTMTFSGVMNALFECLQDCTTAEERQAIFCTNAVRIYKIKAELNQSELS